MNTQRTTTNEPPVRAFTINAEPALRAALDAEHERERRAGTMSVARHYAAELESARALCFTVCQSTHERDR